MTNTPQDPTERLHSAKKKSGRVRITVVLVVVAILGITATAATQLYMAYRLPDPETADLDGLFRWLVTVDLKDYPPETHQILIRRLEEELNSSKIDLSGDDGQLTDEYREQLWSNIELLMRPWFFGKMEQYYAAEPSEKIKVIDRLFDQSRAWQKIIDLAPPGKINAKRPQFDMVVFMTKKIKEWKRTSTPEEAKRLTEFVTVLKARWLLRQISEIKEKLSFPKIKAPLF